MDKQSKEAKKMAKELPFKEKVSYIWLYYKWWIIGTAAVIILICSTTYEILNRPKYDLEISYYTNMPVSNETINSMEEYFSQFTDDIDHDGKCTVKIYNTALSFGSNDPSAKAAIQSKFIAELAAKSYPVYLFDDLFAEIIKQDTYTDSFDQLVDICENTQLKEKLGVKDGEHIYWATRIIYDNEKNKPERQTEYKAVKKLEKSIMSE